MYRPREPSSDDPEWPGCAGCRAAYTTAQAPSYFAPVLSHLWITSHCEWPAAQPARNWDVGPPRGSHCAKGIGLWLKVPQKCSDVRLFTLPKRKASQQTSRDQQGDPYKVGPLRISVLLRLVFRHASTCPQLQQWRAR